MNYKLQNIKTTELSELEREITLGAKFIVFNYRIGLGFVSLLRFSPAIFIKRENEIEHFKKKYNLFNILLGPWTLFKGPLFTYNAYKTNKNGGIDVTKDVMTNITQESFLKNEVKIEFIHTIFSKVKASDKKDIIKAIERTDLNIVPLKKVFLGLFVNVEEYQEPYFVIGVELYKETKFHHEYIKDNLNKYFYKHIEFDIFRISDNPEFGERLIEQGELIYGK